MEQTRRAPVVLIAVAVLLTVFLLLLASGVLGPRIELMQVEPKVLAA
jgi:hypothetical protein